MNSYAKISVAEMTPGTYMVIAPGGRQIVLTALELIEISLFVSSASSRFDEQAARELMQEETRNDLLTQASACQEEEEYIIPLVPLEQGLALLDAAEE